MPKPKAPTATRGQDQASEVLGPRARGDPSANTVGLGREKNARPPAPSLPGSGGRERCASGSPRCPPEPGLLTEEPCPRLLSTGSWDRGEHVSAEALPASVTWLPPRTQESACPGP